MAGLQKIIPLQKDLIRSLYRTDWVVYAKEPFAGPEQVVEYLGRYTHKAAISNHRIIKISDDGVAFRWRDYRDHREKVMQLLRTRIFTPVLPAYPSPSFRSYPSLRSSLNETQNRSQATSIGVRHENTLEAGKEELEEICRQHLNYDPDLCPHCGKGKMITIERLLPGRSPPIGISYRLDANGRIR